MMQDAKISTVHRQRLAVVYVRQSSSTQLERNRESTMRQYNFVARAIALGWTEAQVHVIDEDQGVSANGLVDRAGFAQLTAEVALGRVGIVLGLEVARLARNSADWYRLLDLCGLTGTILADEDGIYDPSAFNDRLLLGLKGTMSEAELHILRARLMAAFATRQRVASCDGGCRSGWSGARKMARSAWIRTKRSPPPSAPCSSASPSLAPSGACGCGFARKSWCFHFDAFQ